jgi:hypothetical protein
MGALLPEGVSILICKTVNLERNLPLASEASVRLSQEIRLAKCSRCRALKVIHGYGSSGKGGAIKAACLKLCAERQRSGMIRHFVRGEDFTPFTDAGRKAIDICPQLKTDVDFGRQNDGITIILF